MKRDQWRKMRKISTENGEVSGENEERSVEKIKRDQWRK